MKLILNNYSIVLLTFFFILLNSSCKKGEDDPAISFMSRKARLTGNWKLKSGELHLTKKSANGHLKVYNYVFEPGKCTIDSSSSAVLFNGNFDLSLSFDKKGKMNFSQTIDTDNFSSSGTWDFEGKIGDYKNKEFIQCQLQSTSGYSNRLDFFNKSVTTFNYRLKELRNKEITLVNDDELISTESDGTEFRVKCSYTFIQ